MFATRFCWKKKKRKKGRHNSHGLTKIGQREMGGGGNQWLVSHHVHGCVRAWYKQHDRVDPSSLVSTGVGGVFLAHNLSMETLKLSHSLRKSWCRSSPSSCDRSSFCRRPLTWMISTATSSQIRPSIFWLLYPWPSYVHMGNAEGSRWGNWTDLAILKLILFGKSKPRQDSKTSADAST